MLWSVIPKMHVFILSRVSKKYRNGIREVSCFYLLRLNWEEQQNNSLNVSIKTQFRSIWTNLFYWRSDFTEKWEKNTLPNKSINQYTASGRWLKNDSVVYYSRSELLSTLQLKINRIAIIFYHCMSTKQHFFRLLRSSSSNWNCRTSMLMKIWTSLNLKYVCPIFQANSRFSSLEKRCDNRRLMRQSSVAEDNAINVITPTTEYQWHRYVSLK